MKVEQTPVKLPAMKDLTVVLDITEFMDKAFHRCKQYKGNSRRDLRSSFNNIPYRGRLVLRRRYEQDA